MKKDMQMQIEFVPSFLRKGLFLRIILTVLPNGGALDAGLEELLCEA